MSHTYTLSRIAEIPDDFWDDYCIHAAMIDGVLMIGTVEVNRHGWPTMAKPWNHPRHLHRLNLFFFLIKKMKNVVQIRHNEMLRRRELYVRY